MRIHSHRRCDLLAGLRIAMAAVFVSLGGLSPVFAGEWVSGDVFVGINGGRYKVYSNAGVFKETIDTGLGGATAGGAFNPSTGRLYTTDFSFSRVVVFDSVHPHAIVQTIDTTMDGGIESESVAIDPSGNVYVGHQASTAILKYDASGAFLAAYNVATDLLGPDELDLAADGRTMFYTSNGQRVMRFDVLTSVQLPDFALLPGSDWAGPLRLLPPFDGSAGLIVSQDAFIQRLDSTGMVVQSYVVPGETRWFALDLDPNGTSFWAASVPSSRFYRINIATGAVEVGPIHSGTGPGTVYALIVLGSGPALTGRFCFGDGSGAPCPCGNSSAPGAQQGCANSLGVGAALFATGSANLFQDTIVLAGSNMPNSSALYLQGTAQMNGGAGVSFGDGLRCAGGAIIRLGAKINTAGASQYPGPGEPSVSVRGLVTAPGDRFYQVWYHNSAAFCTPATFNLTNGARVTWVP